MRSQLENITKIKVMKKRNNLPVQNFKVYSRVEKNQYQDSYKISHIILEHVDYREG